jgi:hypothetical protein
MRTTVRLDDALLRDAKRLAAKTGQSLTSVIEDALREKLMRRKALAKGVKATFPTSRGRGLRPGIDLDHSAALLDVMEERGANVRREATGRSTAFRDRNRREKGPGPLI